MSYVIAGRAIKNEYLALGTLGLTGLIVSMAMGGSKKDKAVPASGKQTIEQVKNAVKIDASSRCVAVRVSPARFAHACFAFVSEEEQFIKNFIAEAEKESKH
ncbi:uncharacterized protein PHACADRAFT_27363 [Phanerochaete carnosa HHB-10118-sp]|uniref:Uncharacterized protein n=1 Tax=Phanerochaete carnosa (strain HHB-10118-sp) TaxID=650164 RepID=K5V1Z5_PHACS|nr:uncharacterized protein PHACADRAFT_27363 [Phanerochaete carnosa HHB-10118-sp]EKM56536.1 hypothetical protein PHACADRAFT_27363 [Phanerochaete carnosa HHB-10118-sp]